MMKLKGATLMSLPLSHIEPRQWNFVGPEKRNATRQAPDICFTNSSA